MALHALMTARAGLEATRNTPITPTRLLYFDEGSHDQKVATIRPTETRASYIEGFRSYAGLERDAFNFSGDATFDGLTWWANVAIKAVAAGTGATADKLWAFLPTHTSDDVKSATVQFGYSDSIGATRPAWEVPGCMADEFTLKWAKGETVKYDAKLMSAKGATQIAAFTGALSDTVTISALGTATTVAIDSATIGATVDNDVLDAEWTLTNGFAYLDTLNNTAVAQEILRPNAKHWELTFSRYYRNDTELDAMIAKTLRKVRIQTTGPALGAAAYRLRLDLYGVYDGDGYEKSEVDGLGVEKFTLVGQYDATATTDFSLELINSLAAIT